MTRQNRIHREKVKFEKAYKAWKRNQQRINGKLTFLDAITNAIEQVKKAMIIVAESISELANKIVNSANNFECDGDER